MVVLCWQVWTDITHKAAVALNNVSLDVGLRMQHLEYHNSWDCLVLHIAVWFSVLHCVGVGSVYLR